MLACDLAVPDSRLIGPSRLQPDQELRRAEQRRGVAGAATGRLGVLVARVLRRWGQRLGPPAMMFVLSAGEFWGATW